MRKIIIVLLALALPFAADAKGGRHSGHKSSDKAEATTATGAKAEHEHVSGYTKKDGTVVQGYDRSTRDDTKANNWSTKGNVNPETGKPGTK